ncbi:dual specificity protein kinase shkC-like, partial [Nematostella vectensis]|uniref:dual specificity protein kinase shkC-like n=1 Tax=Nematostella vectensis TaxID=45351 RepID=UPI0020772D95
KKTFPNVQRKRIHSCWYYFGIKAKEQDSCVLVKPSTPALTAHADQDKLNTTNNSQPGTEFKCYKIPSLNIFRGDLQLSQQDCIGEGTFGKCFSGIYKGVTVAVKTFKDQQDYKAVHKECEILTEIPSHPNIAMLVGVSTDEIPFLLLTKLCTINGIPKTYSTFLREENNSLSKGVFLSVMYDMCFAISHMHQQHILHNDIKSNNFIIEKVGSRIRPILIDFGKATRENRPRAMAKMTYSERTLYRRKYPHIAPEISVGKRQSIASDIFSFGYLYCTSLKVIFETDSREGYNELFKLGQLLTHHYPSKRITIEKAMVIINKALECSIPGPTDR